MSQTGERVREASKGRVVRYSVGGVLLGLELPFSSLGSEVLFPAGMELRSLRLVAVGGWISSSFSGVAHSIMGAMTRRTLIELQALR